MGAYVPRLKNQRKPHRPPSIARKERQRFYNTSTWHKLRALKLEQVCYLCEDCLAEGKITEATDVHHMLSFAEKGISEAERQRRFTDIDNLVCLCRYHHLLRHGLVKDKKKNGKGDIDNEKGDL